MQRKTGARGLRTILENVLLDTMYELPSLRNVQKVVVDEAVILGESKPYVLYGSEERAAGAGRRASSHGRGAVRAVVSTISPGASGIFESNSIYGKTRNRAALRIHRRVQSTQRSSRVRKRQFLPQHTAQARCPCCRCAMWSCIRTW
jgi:hypothetical protein